MLSMGLVSKHTVLIDIGRVRVMSVARSPDECMISPVDLFFGDSLRDPMAVKHDGSVNLLLVALRRRS
jgi:hypothetical protein